MSDFNSSLPVRTENDGDLVVKVSDASTPSQQLAIDSSGRPTVKLDDGNGNAVTSQTNGAQRALDVGINVSGTQIDPRDQGAPNTSANGWPTKITDGTHTAAVTASNELQVSVTSIIVPTVKIEDTSGASITVGQKAMSASLPVVIASDQTDVGVKLHDGSDNSITSTSINSKQRLDVNSASDGAAGSAAPFQTAQVGGTDGTNLRAIKTDTSGQVLVNIKDSTGASITTSNPLPVVVSQTIPGTSVNKYNTTAALAAGASANHDYSITSGKTFAGKKFWASGSGKIRMDVATSPDGSTFTTFWTGFNSTAFPNVSVDLDLLSILDTGTGSKIRIIIANDDKQAFDVYSTISGVEN